MSDAILGVSMDTAAEIMSKHGELTAQHGERSFEPHFNAFLAEKGIQPGTWAEAWNGWWARMQADPTGKLHASFSTMQRKYLSQAHMADIPDASQDEKAGVSLDMYAMMMAKIAGGGDPEALLAENGLNMQQWQDAQKGWNDAMAADVNHHLTSQYGTLYAKHTPGFYEKMEAQTAAIMADNHAERAAGIPDEPEVEYTFEDMVRELDDPKPNTRWSAAHHVLNRWDIGDRDDPALVAAAKKAHTLALDCVEQHNEFTISNAESCANDLSLLASEGFMTVDEASDAEGGIGRCLERGKEKLNTLLIAFEPIRDKAVPERVTMQSQIQDYESLVETLTDLLEDWESNYSAPQTASAASSSSPSSPMTAPSGSTQMQTQDDSGGDDIFSVLKRIPIIGDILRALGL